MQELPRQQAAIVHLSSMQLNAGPATHHLGEAPLGLDVPEISLQQHQVWRPGRRESQEGLTVSQFMSQRKYSIGIC